VQLPVAAPYPGLGIDRWLAVQPVWRELGAAFCVVDCGSAITLDVVDEGGVHRGGWIAPGLETAHAGLLARAPVLARPRSDVQGDLGPATDTAQAIERGLLLQQAGLVALALRQVRRLAGCADAELVLTGGDAARLQLQSVPELAAARIEPDLVLRGLAMAVQSIQAQ
jgi:type III pantothenate kinase